MKILSKLSNFFMRRNNTTLGENLFGLKKQLNNKMTDRLQELEITKQLKILENDLRKQENNLFFDMAQVDVDTENEIKELTAKTRFKASPSNYFTLYFEKM